MENEWKVGEPIPEKYRNVLYAWEGGGYDGCFWEMNQGVVTADGHWDPFHSTGRNGLDCDEQHDADIRKLKESLGFSCGRYGRGPNVDDWFSTLRYNAQEEGRRKFYGEKYHDNPDYFDMNATTGSRFVDKYREQVETYVKEKTAKEAAVYAEYKERRKKLDAEWHEDLDAVFMAQVEAQARRPPNLHSWDYVGPARDRWEEYPLDEERIKASCERFCREYAGTVGVMAGVLDALNERGYEVWCTCSDCGEQFQLSDYEKFLHLIDENNYHGDGGIGCIFTRIQCEGCRRDTECPKCFEPNLPSVKDVKEGHAYDHWTFQERFVGIWMGVCDCCAYNFLSKEEYRHWRDDLDNLEATIDRAKADLDAYGKAMKESGKSEEEADELCAKNLAAMKRDWVRMFNDLRKAMQEDVKAHFDDCPDWAEYEVSEDELENYL